MSAPERPSGGEPATISELLRWSQRCGAEIDAVEIVEISAEEGRGLVLKRAVSAGETILSIPSTTLWSAPTAVQHLTAALPSFQFAQLRPDDLLALHLLYEKNVKGQASFWAPHIAALPTVYTLPTGFSDEDLFQLEGSNAFPIIVRTLAQLRGDWESLRSVLFRPHPEVFPPVAFSLDEYKWALATLHTRAMDFPTRNGPPRRILAPVADMMNAALEAGGVHLYDERDGAVRVVAARDLTAGSEVRISYGEPGDGSLSNARLLRLYGFTFDRNPHDVVELWASMSEVRLDPRSPRGEPRPQEAPLYKAKRKLFADFKIDPACPFLLSLAEPLPPQLLRCIRIQFLDEGDYRKFLESKVGGGPGWDFSSPISPESEQRVLQALLAAVQGMLEGYKTTLEADEAAWAAHEAGAARLSYNRRNALLVRLGEKRILFRTLTALAALHVAL